VSNHATEDACLEAYQDQFDYLMRTLQRLGVQSFDLEDVAHEVFLVLRRTWHEYDLQRPLRPYLFGIAFRMAASHRRRYWRETPVEVIDAPDNGGGPHEHLEARRARALILAALQHIPLPRRTVLVMYDLDEIPLKQVASTLSIPLFTAYSRLRKARRELESAIKRLQVAGVR
jgi:RNA polymerase sigma-70 factor (ECF subfamily)